MAYSDKVLDHYENPRNVGAFEKGDDTVGTGMVGAPACGDVMKLQIKVGADGMRIMDKIDGDGQMDPALLPHFVAPVHLGRVRPSRALHRR